MRIPPFALGACAGMLATSLAWGWGLRPPGTANDYQDGQIKAAYDILFDGYYLYFDCLSEQCSRELVQSQAVTATAAAYLCKLDVAPICAMRASPEWAETHSGSVSEANSTRSREAGGAQ